jgi:hypothetical protein
MRALRKFADNLNPGSYSNRLRELRFAYFRQLLATLPPFEVARFAAVDHP